MALTNDITQDTVFNAENSVSSKTSVLQRVFIMGSMCDLSILPSDYSKEVIREIINDAHYTKANVAIEPGSEKGDNYLGNILRIKITGIKSDGSEENMHLIMKLAPIDEDLRALVTVDKYYGKEVYSYKTLLPFFNKLQDEYNIPLKERFNFAGCYKASAEPYKELIVMEDLSVKAFKMYDRLKSFDAAHLQLAIKNLAKIHAFSFVMKAKYPELFAEMAAHACNSIDLGESFEALIRRSFTEAINLMDDEICEEKLRNFSKIHYEKLKSFLEPELAAPYNVICHGDSWSNNMLFKYEGSTPVDMRTLDWQIIRHTSPVTDLAYLIFLGTDEQTRVENYPVIFDLYYEALRYRLRAMNHDVQKCYPEEVFKDHLQTILPYGLIFAVLGLPLTLSERGNAPDVTEMLLEDETIGKKRILSKICVERLRGVVKDFVKYDLI